MAALHNSLSQSRSKGANNFLSIVPYVQARYVVNEPSVQSHTSFFADFPAKKSENRSSLSSVLEHGLKGRYGQRGDFSGEQRPKERDGSKATQGVERDPLTDENNVVSPRGNLIRRLRDLSFGPRRKLFLSVASHGFKTRMGVKITASND